MKPEIVEYRLNSALRQYRRNDDNSPDKHDPEKGFVNAYSVSVVEALVRELQQEIKEYQGYKPDITQRRRDEFAAAALQGMVEYDSRHQSRDPNKHWQDAIAEEAYEIADAMLAARAKP